MDSQKTCRLCLERNSIESIELFDSKGKELGIAMMISKYFWFEPLESDGNSPVICINCWINLNNFHNFYKLVKEAHESLARTITKIENGAVNIKQEKSLELIPDNQNQQDESLSETLQIQSENDSTSDYDIPLSSIKQEIYSNELKREYSKNDKLKSPPKKRGRKPKQTVVDAEKKLLTDKSSRSALRYIGVKTPIDREQLNREDQQIREFVTLECKICAEKNLNSFLEVKLHYRRTHSIKGYVRCCKKKFFRRGTLLEHIEWHANPNLFSCHICKKIFSNRRGKEYHIQNHHGPEDQKQFKCDICKRSFLKKYLLSHHMSIIHIPEEKKIHKCPQCGKGFALHSILRSHIRSIHEFANVNVCEICAKVFKSKAQWARHKLMEHSEQKPQKRQCTICQRWLKTEISLYGHMQRFHDQIPVACEICGKISKNKYALRSHVRYVHETKRQHECSVCSKAFRKLLELKEHMASHTGDVLYVCSYCPTTFNSSGNMHAHQKRKHPIEWQLDRDKKIGPEHL